MHGSIWTQNVFQAAKRAISISRGNRYESGPLYATWWGHSDRNVKLPAFRQPVDYHLQQTVCCGGNLFHSAGSFVSIAPLTSLRECSGIYSCSYICEMSELNRVTDGCVRIGASEQRAGYRNTGPHIPTLLETCMHAVPVLTQPSLLAKIVESAG